ncbi:MAG: hypothetical protein EZS28_010183, partial [Streblomastix strix]
MYYYPTGVQFLLQSKFGFKKKRPKPIQPDPTRLDPTQLVMSGSDDTRSVQSSASTNSRSSISLETSIAYTRFSKIDDLLFQYIYSFKMHEAKYSGLGLGVMLGLQTFQAFFQPLKRSDITSIGFQEVLYFDPSFYLPSNTTLIVFFILFAIMFFTTVFIGVLMTAFNIQEKRVPEDLQTLSQLLVWTTLIVSPGVMYNIMTRPLNCIIHLDQVFSDYCHPRLNLAEAIIGIIIMILTLVFSFVVRLFSFEPLMHAKFIVASRDGIFNGWLLVVQNLNNVIQTILVEENPLYSAIIHIIIYGLYGAYVIFKVPYKRIAGNQLAAVCLWISASGGILSLILTPLNALSSIGNVGLKVLANIIFYLALIIIVVISAFAAYILAGRIARNKWVIKPVTVLKETKHQNPAELNKEIFNLNKKGLNEQQKQKSTTPRTSGNQSGSSSLQSTVTNLSTQNSLVNPDTANININKQKIKLKEITVGFSIMMGEGEEIGYILNPVLEEVPEQFHQHLGAQKHVIRVLTKEHGVHDMHHHHPHHHIGHHSGDGHHSVTHHHQDGKHSATYHQDGKHSASHHQDGKHSATHHEHLDGNHSVENPDNIRTPVYPITGGYLHDIPEHDEERLHHEHSEHSHEHGNHTSNNNEHGEHSAEHSHEHGNHSVTHHREDEHQQHGDHSVTHHLDGHHSGIHSITPHHLGNHSVHSHLGSSMLLINQQGTLGQTSEKTVSLKSSSSSLSKAYADIPRDSFEIPYINDYPTYVWAPDLSSHPELLMATYPLKSNTQLNKSVLKPYKTVSDLDKSLMYLQNESLAQSMNVLKFTDSLYASFLRKEEFRHSAELHIAYAFFLQDYRPAMQMKLLAHLQKACEYFPGWTSRWVVYRLMRQAEEQMESGKGINQQGIGGNQQQQVASKSQNAGSNMMDSKQHTINIQLQQAEKQYEIAKAHLMRVWSLLTRRSVDVDKVEHHIRIASQNARLAQEQYNTLLIAHSENPNILRQYSVLMRDLYGDDRLAIEMLGEADLMEEDNKADLLKNEDELGQNNDIWGVDADQTNQQQQEGEQKDNEGQDDNSGSEEEKTLQKSDSLSDVNIVTNKSSTKSASQSTSNVILAGSQKAEILKKLQTKQTKQPTTLILIFSFLFISLGLVIVLFIFSYVFVDINFISAVDAGRAERRAIVVAELMNTALDYSTYYMFEVLMLDQDGGSELDDIYTKATGVTYPLLIELNQEYHQLYQWAYYRKEWRNAKVTWNEVKLQNITVGRIGAGPDMMITNSTTDELKLTRFIQWVEDAINIMLQLFTYNPEDTTRERGDFYTMKQQLAVLALNVPFAATEEMKIVAQDAHKVVQSDADISIIVVAVCFVVATLIMIIGSNIPLGLEISKIIKDRKAKIRVLCNITVDDAQKMYTLMQDRSDPNERKRVKRKKKRGDGGNTSRSGGTEETRSYASGASNQSGKSGQSGESESSESERSNIKQIPSNISNKQGLNKSGSSSASKLRTKLDTFKKRALNRSKIQLSRATLKSGASGASKNSGSSSDNKSQDSFASGASMTSLSSRSTRASNESFGTDNKIIQNKDPMFEKMQQMQQTQQGQDIHQGAQQHPGIHPGMHPRMMQHPGIHPGMHPDMHQGMIMHPGMMQHLGMQPGMMQHPDVHQGMMHPGMMHQGMIHSGMMHPSMMHDGNNGYTTAQYQQLQQYGYVGQGIDGQIQGEGKVDEKGMIVGANGEVLMDQQFIEGQEQFNEEEEEMKRIAEQRAEDVDEKLKHLGNIVPISVPLRMIIGTILIVIATSSFYIIAIISLSSLSDKAAQITINECRIVKVIQISAFSTMYVSNTVYRTNDTSMIVKIDKYTSAAFKDNSYAMSEDNLRTVILSLQQILNTLTDRFQFGPETLAITGDPLLDAFHVPRTQGKDSFVDEVFQGSTECLFVNTDTDQTRTDNCNQGDRMPGMSYPYNGLEQLLIHFYLCVQDTMNKDPTTSSGIDFNNDGFQYIIESVRMDIKEGLNRIGDYLVNKLESYSQQYNTILLVLFIVVSFLIIILSLVFFVTLPILLIQIADRTAHIELIGKVKNEEDIVVWTEDLNTGVKRIDSALQAIIKTLSNAVRCVDYKEDKEVVIEVMDELIVQLMAHQTDEEELMSKNKFPSSLELAHKSAHVAIIRKVINFHEEMIKRKLSVNETIIFCSTLLPSHIHSQDAELALFLGDKESKEVLNQEIVFNEVRIPPSLDAFNNGPNASMIEKIQFDKLIDRIKEE